MSFSRYFKISSYCLFSTGFLAIAATGAIDILSLALFAGTLILSWFVDTRALARHIPAWALNCLVFLFLAFSFFDYRFISRSFVVSAVHLLFFASAIKLLTISTDRDYFYLYLISFAELLAAATLTINIVYGILFFIFLHSAVSASTLFEMRRSSAKAVREGRVRPLIVSSEIQGTGTELFSRFPAGLMLGMTLCMTFLILLLAIPLFVLLPRISMGALSQPRQRSQLVSGFSDRVELGRGGTISESDAIVMRVRVSEPPEKLPAGLKWRGLSLEQFDGKSWRRGADERQRVLPQAHYYKLEESAQGTDLLWQTFFLEAFASDVVFASHKVLAVSDDLDFVQRDSAGNLFTPRRALRKLRYAAISDRIQPVIEAIPITMDIPESIKQSCLQLPPLDPRVEELARKVTQSIENPYAKALALERYLRDSYSYSLESEAAQKGQDPIALFLFESRRGHCEYFASALAVMLRQLGIPARLVNGFRAGEYNSIGDAFVVRQYNAHSWVEAYFSPYGWLELDPTPVQPRQARSAFVQLISDTLDALDLWWWDEVVNYDFGKQYNLVQDLRSGAAVSWIKFQAALDQLKSKGQSALNSFDLRKILANMPGLLALSTVLIFLGFSLLFWRRPRWFRRLKNQMHRAFHLEDENAAVVGFYMEALDILGSHGLIRQQSQTPLEFAASLQGNPAAEPLKALTHLYNSVRYDVYQRHSSANEARKLLATLNNALHPSKRILANTDAHQ